MVSKPKMPPPPPPPPHTPTRADASVQAAGIRQMQRVGSGAPGSLPSWRSVAGAASAISGAPIPPLATKTGGKKSLIGGS